MDKMSSQDTQSTRGEPEDILVEFALKARQLMNEGKFFDKDKQPQEGTELLNTTVASLQQLQQVQIEKAIAELQKPGLCGNKYCNKLKGHKDMCYAMTYTVSTPSQIDKGGEV